MTDDIVTRLKWLGCQYDHSCITCEAADEIERLRAEVKHMAALLWEFEENTDEHESATMFILHRAVMKIEKPVKP